MLCSVNVNDAKTDLFVNDAQISILIRYEASNLYDFYGDAIKEVYNGKQKIILDFSSEAFAFSVSNPVDNSDFYFFQIHNLIDRLKIPYSSVEFYNGNILNAEMYEQWKSTFNITNSIAKAGFRLAWASTVLSAHKPLLTPYTVLRPYYFTCLNGAPRRHRMHIIKLLWDGNLFEKGIITFVADDDQTKKSFTNEGYNKLAELLPLTVDEYTNFTDIRSHRSDLSKSFYDCFNNSYFDIITETLYGEGLARPCSDKILLNNRWWKEVFFTEKTFRSIYYKRPFMLFSSVNSLEYLKQLGFKTFDFVFDEGYDQIVNWKKRLNFIVQHTAEICNKPIQILHRKIASNQMQDVLEHNYNQFINIAKNSDFKLLGTDQLVDTISKSQ